MASSPVIEHLSDNDTLGMMLLDVEAHQYELNRSATRRAAALADAVAFARTRPDIYALPGDPDPVGTAERCVIIDAALRLQLSQNQIRTLTHTVDQARTLLPALWERAWEGFATLTQLETAVLLLSRFTGHDEARAVFDDTLAETAPTCPPGSFRAKARRLADRLAPADPVTEHRDAYTTRRLHIEPDVAGMSWLHLYTDTTTARAIYRRATATAKNMRKRARHGNITDPRTRDQVRADLAAGWLTGAGTPTAVKTKVFLTIPADVLTDTARTSIRPGLPVPAGAPNLNDTARLDTGDTIDRATATRMLLHAGSFTRVITDPVTGVVLDMDRRARKATRQQREWLLLTRATCARDGCTCPTAESDIDHWTPYNSPDHGPTNLTNLGPLCATDNQDKQRTRLTYRRRPGGTVELTTPTGHTTRDTTGDAPRDTSDTSDSIRTPRPGEREAQELLQHIRDNPQTTPPDTPPF